MIEDNGLSKGAAAGQVPSNIAQAGEKLLDAAKQSLLLSEKPAFLSKKHTRRGFSLPFAPHTQLTAKEREKLAEVVDNNDRPLLCMLPEEALRQGLAVRTVAVALRERHNRLIVHKRRELALGFMDSWDIYTGFVLVGEARKDAALRLLASVAGLSGLSVTPVSACGGHTRASGLFALFTADLPTGLHPGHAADDMMPVDADELAGLIRDVPELLSPELVKAASMPGLFRP
jgi:hypothetical protein